MIPNRSKLTLRIPEREPDLATREYRPDCPGWNVEIYLKPGGVVRERSGGRHPREAIETALARSYIVPSQVESISAHPLSRSISNSGFAGLGG
jgi:hypothetical protein